MNEGDIANGFTSIRDNIGQVRSRMTAAAAAAGRIADDVTLIAAAKYASAGQIAYLCRECGLRAIGENRVNQLLAHYGALGDDVKEKLEIHFIGRLQTNKVKYIIDKVCLIHSLDSYSLADEIEKQAARRGIVARVLVEINSGHETSKGGVLPEDAEEFCAGLSRYPHIELCGFMTMAPKCVKNDEYFHYFSETYKLVLDIWTEKLHNIYGPVLSMGMSDSYETAIAAGATCVRVGSAIFGYAAAATTK